MKSKIILVMVLASMFTVANLMTTSRSVEPRYGGTLVMAPRIGEPKLTPFEKDFEPGSIINNIYDSLVVLNGQAEVIPSLAKSWSISEDGLTYTFDLVRNATFHDGVPVTSADVKFSLLDIALAYNPMGPIALNVIDTIETPDDYTVVINLKYAGAIDFLEPLAMHIGYSRVVPKHLYENTDILTNPYNEKPIGSGPYKFVEWVKGDHITIERNENYWKSGRPYVDKIVYKFFTDFSTFAVALEAGEVDLMGAFHGMDLEILSELQKTKNIFVDEGVFDLMCPNAFMLAFNMRRSPFDDVRVRQAFAHAIDRDYIVKYACHDFGQPCYSPITPTMEWAYDPSVETRYPLNLTKAEELLDEAGYPRGQGGVRFSVNILLMRECANDLKIAEVLREQLGEIGVDLVLEKVETALVIEKIADKDLDMCGFSLGYAFDFQIAGRSIYDPRVGTGLRNDPTGYNDSRVLELFDLDEQEPDKDIRKEYLREAQDIMLDDCPLVWIWSYPYPWVYRDGVNGVPEDCDAGGTLWENVWVDWAPEPTTELDALVETVAAIESDISQLTMVTTISIALGIVAIVLAVAAIYYTRRARAPKI